MKQNAVLYCERVYIRPTKVSANKYVNKSEGVSQRHLSLKDEIESKTGEDRRKYLMIVSIETAIT
jgi:hypothetical protein